MKVVILAGGLPSAITDGYEGIPKPMAEIGERPLLWHIMKLYSYYGYKEFIICAGYKGDMIKRYFMDYYIYQSDITINLETNQIEIHKKKSEDWKVTVLDTGVWTTVLQRISQVKAYIEDDAFLVTYGDCISDIKIPEIVEQFYRDSRLAVTAVAKPAGRHQLISVDRNGDFMGEKAGLQENESWVDACTMVLSSDIFPYIERYPVQEELFGELRKSGQVTAYCHEGFWRAIETMRDRMEMEKLWSEGQKPWKVWKD